MILHSLTATFGCLNNATLELADGLNVIQAPNESGKSTWLAFLRAMLYGFSARERGALADKNRYQPWNGAAMKGRIDLTADGKDLVIVRDTVRAGAPMGRFYAAYDGSATQVEGMTGQNAGELLTGVPRAVFERSAFIRQSGLAIDQDAELEKRIASLISSGEEDTSYIETEKRLRTERNRRRHNKTGILPRTEEELDGLREKLSQLEELRAQTAADRGALEELEQLDKATAEKLARHDRMDIIEAKRELFAARAEAERLEQEAAAVRSEIDQAHLPPAEQLIRIKCNAANLLTTQVSMNHVQSQAEEAKKATAAAQAEVDASQFAPQEPEAAAEKVRQDMEKYRALQTPSKPLAAMPFLFALAAVAFRVMAYYSTLPSSLLSYLSIIAILGTAVTGSLLYRSRKRARQEAQALLQGYGVETVEEIDPLLIEYNQVYQQWMAQKDSEAQIVASWQNFYQTYKKLSGEILEETSSFFPDIENIHQVSPILDEGLKQWKRLQALTNRAVQERTRCEALQSRLPDDMPLTAEEASMTRPDESRETLAALARRTAEEIAAVRSRMDRTAGEMSAIGDRAALAAQLDALERTRTQAQEEYDAIALAMEALEQANAELQSRFSPALGRRAGEIFEELTGGSYQKVLLDRNLNAFAEGGDAIPREASYLSQGAADQLYLAVRLAICDQVLPAEKRTPLILDDTLINFDEDRMASALDWLRREAERRQILLFTCQRREAVYLQNAENVHIISLSANRWR